MSHSGQTTWSGWISAGWLIVGSIKSQLEMLAFSCNVSIRVSVSVGLTGRRVDFAVRGTASDVEKFKRGVSQASVGSIYS